MIAPAPVPPSEDPGRSRGPALAHGERATLAHGAPPSDEQRWASWLVERNRRGLRVALWIVAIYHPSFAVLDWIVAPRHVTVLLAERAVSIALTLAGFAVLRTRTFERHPNAISSAYMVSVAGSIAAMIPVIGGFSSAYHSGLSLTMIGAGLLFVWPVRVTLLTHGLIVAMYVIPNVVMGSLDQAVIATTHVFFVVGTAVIVVAGHLLGYRSQQQQVLDRLALERTTANLEQAHEQLKQLDRFKSRFFANITHELKTPLAMVLSPLDLMLEGDLGSLTDAQRGTLGTMLRHGLKLLKLIGDLLDLSRLEHSHVRLELEEHDLVGWLRSLVAQVEPLAQRKELTLRLESNVESCPVWCDLDQLERVFVNLLSNATKFTPQGGHVVVRVEEAGAEVRIAVADDGPGFPPSEAGRVFDRFYQVEMEDTRRHGGTGIGLALARELVELHEGRIYARSDGGRGATFTVELPRGRGQLDASLREGRAAERERLRGHPGEHGLAGWLEHLTSRGEYRLLEIDSATERRVVERDPDEEERAHTVLVVEDSPDIIRVVHMALHHHFRVLAAGDGRRGLELARKELPDLVITDLMMPELDGLGLTRELRADPRTRGIPIVMLTARGDLEDRVRGLDTGVDAYLAKPFAARELVSTAQSLLELRRTSADILLTQRMDSLEIVAGGLAHQINNPLGYVKNALELARRDVDTVVAAARLPSPSAQDRARIDRAAARLGEMFAVARSGLERIAETVELMTQYSREGYSRVPQPFDVFGAARRVADMIRPSTGREVSIDCECRGDGTIACVPQEVVQALTNLVQNAVEAVSDGTGRVVVRGEGRDGAVVLSVADNGAGIPAEVQRRLFTPFYTTKGAGHGMGLTIAWRVVQSLGGSIEVDSREGRGTTFTLRLPREPAAAAPGAA